MIKRSRFWIAYGVFLAVLLACEGVQFTAGPLPASTQVVIVTQVVPVTRIIPVTPVELRDRALQFDGYNDCVELGDWFDFEEFSLSLWVKPATQRTVWANIIDDNHTDYRAWVVQQNETHNNQYLFGAGSRAAIIYFDLTPEIWHHIVMVRSRSESRVYVDGKPNGKEIDLPLLRYDGTQFLRLGCWGGGDRHWAGTMDEVQIWQRALTDAEIESLTTRPLDGNEEGLAAYYQFDEGQSEIVRDASAWGRDGVLRGNPEWVLAQRTSQ
jgi:hypothetical protein